MSRDKSGLGADRLADRCLRSAITTTMAGMISSAASGGHNILFHNNGDGTFTDVTRKAGLYEEQIRWGARLHMQLDYDRDGHLDLFVCHYIKLDPEKTPSSSEPPVCQWKGIPTMCVGRAAFLETLIFCITTTATELLPTFPKNPAS